MADKVKSEADKRRAALALNMCMVSVSQIIDYKDVNILRQEYDAILNNINLQHVIKDETLLNAFRSILDIVTFYLIQEGDKEMAEREYKLRMKNAIFDAFPRGAFIAGGDWVSMGAAIGAMVGVGYLNYRRSKARSGLDLEKRMWELQRSAIEQLHGLRRSLFETAWRLSETYQFPDEWRLTEKQITQYNQVLMDSDPHRQYDRMTALDRTFVAFPPFWYFKARSALETCRQYEEVDKEELASEFRAKALTALDKFDEAYFPLMREDIIAASAALDKFSLLRPGTDREQMINLLTRAKNVAGSAFDVLQICAVNYIALGETEEAMSILRNLVNEDYNTQLNGRILSRLYCELKERHEYDFLCDRIGLENILPWAETVEDAQVKQLTCTRKRLAEAGFELLQRFFAARTQKLAAVMFQDLNAWDDGLTGLKSWKDQVAIGEPFDSWGVKIEIELNEAYNELANDVLYKSLLIVSWELWEKNVRELVDVSKGAIDKLSAEVCKLREKEQALFKLMGKHKTSAQSEYVITGKSLRNAVRECMDTLFKGLPEILHGSLERCADAVASERDLDGLLADADRRAMEIVIPSVTAMADSGDDQSEGTTQGFINFFEEEL